MLQPRTAKVREWTDRFERFQRSKVSLTQFCRDEGVSMPSFYQWRKRIVATPAVNLPKSSDNKASLDRSLVGNDARPVRITIESAGIVIQCDCDSLQAIDTVLSWANRQRESGFQQLIVRS
jgi:hypothetical protein